MDRLGTNENTSRHISLNKVFEEQGFKKAGAPEIKVENISPLKSWWAGEGLDPDLLNQLLLNIDYIDRLKFDKALGLMASDLVSFAGGEPLTVLYEGGRKKYKKSGDFILENLKPKISTLGKIEFVNYGDFDNAIKVNKRSVAGEINKIAYIDDWTLSGSQFLLDFGKHGGNGRFLDRVAQKKAFFVAANAVATEYLKTKSTEEGLGWQFKNYIDSSLVGTKLTQEQNEYLHDKIPNAAGWSGWPMSSLIYGFWKLPDNFPKLFTGADNFLTRKKLKPILNFKQPYYK